MNPNRVDFLVDLAYGAMIFIAVVLIVVVGNRVGFGFGIGVLISYLIHVVWKMARFDPDWMTREVTETVEQTVDKEVTEVIEQLDEINTRVDRRPRTEEIEATVDERIEEQTGEVEATVEKKIDEQTEAIESKIERKTADGGD